MFKFESLYVFYLVSGASILLSPCLKSILIGDIEMARNFKTIIVLKCFSSESVLFFFSDFDECANNTDDCDVNAYCNNTVGSFNCTCNSGYTGNGTACAGKYDYFILDRSSSIYFSYIAQSNRPVGSFSLEIKTN